MRAPVSAVPASNGAMQKSVGINSRPQEAHLASLREAAQRTARVACFLHRNCPSPGRSATARNVEQVSCRRRAALSRASSAQPSHHGTRTDIFAGSALPVMTPCFALLVCKEVEVHGRTEAIRTKSSHGHGCWLPLGKRMEKVNCFHYTLRFSTAERARLQGNTRAIKSTSFVRARTCMSRNGQPCIAPIVHSSLASFSERLASGQPPQPLPAAFSGKKFLLPLHRR